MGGVDKRAVSPFLLQSDVNVQNAGPHDRKRFVQESRRIIRTTENASAIQTAAPIMSPGLRTEIRKEVSRNSQSLLLHFSFLRQNFVLGDHEAFRASARSAGVSDFNRTRGRARGDRRQDVSSIKNFERRTHAVERHARRP